MVMVVMLIRKIGWGAAIWMVVISAAVVVVMLIIKIMIINFIVTGISIPMINTMTR